MIIIISSYGCMYFYYTLSGLSCYHNIGEQDILSLTVKCDNTLNGCEWIGELRSLENHLTICGFTLLPCPNECKDGKKTVKLLRKNIKVHKKEVCPRRRYKCPHCRESGEYQERTTTHLEECLKMKIPCPNDGCDEEIERCGILHHQQKCLFEEVFCKYIDIGCKKKILRKDVEEHKNDSQQHLQLAIDTVNHQEMTINTLEYDIEQLQDKLAQLQSTPMKFKITDFDDLKTFDENVFSPAFYTSSGGYKMCIKINVESLECNNGYGYGYRYNDSDGYRYGYSDSDSDGYSYGYGYGDGYESIHVSVFAYLMRGENDDDLPWPFTGTVTVELLNQLEDENHYSDEINLPSYDESSQRVVNDECSLYGYGIPQYIPHSDLGYNAAKNCHYLKDDCLYFRVKVYAVSSSKPWLV